MAGGIAKQLSLCANLNTTTVDINPIPTVQPTWCTSTDLVNNLQAAQVAYGRQSKVPLPVSIHLAGYEYHILSFQ